MQQTTLTIGIATHTDFDGLYFTVNALRQYHAEAMPRVDLVCVDNAPQSECGKRAQGFFEHINAGISDANSVLPQPRSARWIPFPEPVGTTAPRQHVFDVAETDAVLIIDSHVLLWPGAVSRLLEHYDTNPRDQSLLSGPLMYDNLAGLMTHFDDVWRAGMWGTWAHDERGNDIDGPPFDIPGMGLGVFTCRKNAWQGFNPHFREFGGEEMYIHEKHRRSGRAVRCLPFLRWQHRFGDPVGGRRSPVRLESKVANYIHGHLELGLPFERLRRHFVDGFDEQTDARTIGGVVSQQVFDLLVIGAAERRKADAEI
jgi:hypothetical protein